jgi:FkbM family methyltransferase
MAPHLRQYMRMFGTFEGLMVYALAKYSRRQVQLTIQDVRGSLALRGGTSDRATFQKVFLEREYDLDLGFVPRVVIDGGANVGYASVYFAQSFPEALVLAVEPEPENFRLLVSNTTAYRNIRCFNYALWPRRTRVAIENPGDNPDAFRVTEGADRSGSYTVQTISIPELLKQAGAESIDLLKLDIEGAEKELFEDESAAAWVALTRAVIVETHDRFKPGCTAAVERALSHGPFHRIRRGESLLFLHNPTA